MIKMNHISILISIIYYIFTQNCLSGDKPIPPTIEVNENYRVFNVSDSPDGENAKPFFQWKAKNCKYVMILGLDLDQHPLEGEIGIGGSYIFVAIGESDIALEESGAYIKRRPGPGRYGVIYTLDNNFRPDEFFKNAYKKQLITEKKPEQIRDAIREIMQNMEYRVACAENKDTKINGSLILYTVDLDYNIKIDQTSKEKEEEGTKQRQIGFVFKITPDEKYSDSHMIWLDILPVIKINYPRDNKSWVDDSKDLQRAIPVCKDLFEKINSTLNNGKK